MAVVAEGDSTVTGRQRERQLKRRTAELLADAGAHLTPGRWQIVDGRTARWIEPRSAARSLAAAAARSPHRGLKSRLIHVRRVLAQPRFVHVPAGSGVAVSAAVTKQGGLVLFDVSQDWVTHVRSVPLPSEYAERRQALSAWYPNPEWAVDDDGRVLRERFAVGRPANVLSRDERCAIFRDLLRLAAARAGASRSGRSTVTADIPLLDALGSASVERWRRAARLETVMVLGHGDATPENVIGHAGTWQLIDFEDAREVPYLYDALSFVVRDADVLASFLRGDVDADWRDALAAAGHDPAMDKTQWLDAAALLAADHHSREHGGDALYTLRRLSEGYASA